MSSYVKVACLSLCVASFALGSAHATNSEQMFSEAASKAISEYRSTRDISALSRLISELRTLSLRAPQNAEARSTLLSVGRDMLNALYETADLDFDPKTKPLINLPSPGGMYSAGTDPEGITDPKMKAEYKAKVAENRRYAEHYREQVAVYGVIDELAQLFRQGFTGMGAREISNVLTRNGMSSSYGDDFLRRMETWGH